MIFPIFEAEHGKYEEEESAFDIHRMRMIVHENDQERRVVVVVIVGWGLTIREGKKGPDDDDVRFSTA